QQWLRALQRGAGIEAGKLRPDPLRRPPGRRSLRVTRFVQRRVQRPGRERQAAVHVVQERVAEPVAVEGALEQVVQFVAAGALAEHAAQGLERRYGERR